MHRVKSEKDKLDIGQDRTLVLLDSIEVYSTQGLREPKTKDGKLSTMNISLNFSKSVNTQYFC